MGTSMNYFRRSQKQGSIDNRKALIEDGRLIREALSDHTEIDAELCEVKTEITVVAQMIEKIISDNAQAPLDQDEYAKSIVTSPNATSPYRSVIRLSRSSVSRDSSRQTCSSDSYLSLASSTSSIPNGRTAVFVPLWSASPFTTTDGLCSPFATAARGR